MQSPLGKYSSIAALIASLGVLTTDLLVHVLVTLRFAPSPDNFLDNLAFAAFGVILGTIGAHTEAIQVAAAKINGMETKIKEVAVATGINPEIPH